MARMPGGMSLLILGSLAVASPGAAQDQPARISGVVRDDEGRPLEGASVEVLGTRARALTGPDGAFRLEVRAGRHWVLARSIGHAPVRVSATLEAGATRTLPLELERLPQRLSELSVLADIGATRSRYFDFRLRSVSAFGTFLTRDDLDRMKPFDLISAVQRYLPGRTRFALEQRFGNDLLSGGRLFRRNSFGDGLFFNAARAVPANCPPSISINGAVPWAGVSLRDYSLDEVEAIEIYRRGSWVPTEFALRDEGGCGLVVVWLR